MSKKRSEPKTNVVTLDSGDDDDDDDEITVLAVVKRSNNRRTRGRRNRRGPSQVEAGTLSDDEPDNVDAIQRKATKRPGAALEGSSASQNNPPSTQSSDTTSRKSARLHGQSSSSVDVALAARKENTVDEEAAEGLPRSDSQVVQNPTPSREPKSLQRENEPMDVDGDVPAERNEEPSTASSSATGRSTLPSAQNHRQTSPDIVHGPLNEPVSSHPPQQRRSRRLQKQEPMEVDDDRVAAVPASRNPNVGDIVADEVTSTPPTFVRRQSARIRARAQTLEAPTETQLHRSPTPFPANRNPPAPKNNSVKVKSERPKRTQRVDEASSMTREAATTSTSSSSQRGIAKLEARISSMAAPILRDIEREDIEVTSQPATSAKVLRNRTIKVEPLDADEEDEANSVTKNAASTSTSSLSQRGTAQLEASTSSMAGAGLTLRRIKEEVVEDLPLPTISKRTLRNRVIIKVEPLEIGVNLEEHIRETPPVKVPPKASSSKTKSSSKKQKPIVNPKPIVFYLPREIPVPLGLTRIPYHVDLSEAQKEALHSLRIQIEEPDNFPHGLELCERYIRNEDDSDDEVEDAGNAPHPKTAVLPDYLGPVSGDYTENKEDAMWSADEIEFRFRGNGERLDRFYENVQNDYLFCLWRQFEGRIPIEVALQHLMENGYDIKKSLETLEKDCLEKVPQKLRHPSAAQALQIYRILWTEKLDDYDYRYIQENILKNFHMSEVVQVFHRFKKFYGFADDGSRIVPGCNCSAGIHRDVCRKVEFQPRFACANCTKNFRKTKFPPTGFCLVCITYQKYARKPRPVKNVRFDDDDLEKMAKWDAMETQLKRRVDVSDFESRYQAQKDSEHRALKITKEESLALEYEKLAGRYFRANIVRQLKPFILPHFTRCQCKDDGWIPVRSVNINKTTFSEEEADLFSTTILQNPGNIQAAADQLDVEKELVERFITAFPRNDPIWMNQLEEDIVVEMRDWRPFEDLPPVMILPKKDKKKRVITPPIPLK